MRGEGRGEMIGDRVARDERSTKSWSLTLIFVQYPKVPNVLRVPAPVTSRNEMRLTTGAEMVATRRSANAAKRRNDPQWMIPGMMDGWGGGGAG